jgi:eukaryotic-like serine/threonine-protein kinase
MPLSPGDKLGPYEILAPIGAGGMGDVYKAHDTRLGRDVAIKVSQERFSDRFEREARAVAALNHPNICTLHDVGPNYLVMEFVEGESPKGPCRLKRRSVMPVRSPTPSKRRTRRASCIAI